MIVYKGFNKKLQATCGKGIFQYEEGNPELLEEENVHGTD